MAEEEAVSGASAPGPAPDKAPTPGSPVRRVTLIVIAVGVVLFLYGIAADRYTPYTAQGLAQAYLVKIAPEVGGRVIEVGVETDQRVAPGAVLFRIDPDERSEEHTSELQSLMRISSAVFCLKKKNKATLHHT